MQSQEASSVENEEQGMSSWPLSPEIATAQPSATWFNSLCDEHYAHFQCAHIQQNSVCLLHLFVHVFIHLFVDLVLLSNIFTDSFAVLLKCLPESQRGQEKTSEEDLVLSSRLRCCGRPRPF